MRCATARNRPIARRIASGASPAHSAQAAAASTFSTLCAPRRKISATGQIASTWPLSVAATQPSRTNTPCDAGRRRLNHTTRARVRRGRAGGQGARGRGGGRLAVGPGDRDRLRLERAPAELELADDRHATGAGRPKLIAVERHARAHDDEVGAVEGTARVWARDETDAE